MKEIQKAGLQEELSILMDDANNLEQLTAGIGTTVVNSTFSIVLGNKGYICTVTVECMRNCSN